MTRSARPLLLAFASALSAASCTKRDQAPKTPTPAAAPADRVDFDRDVRPILSANCYACHGPDEASRDMDLRLDTLEGMTADLGGYQAVVPGYPDKSELMVRVRASDPDERMPPVDSHKTLSDEEIRILENWIAQGAKWQGHWAFEPIRAPTAPALATDDWSRTPIDRFVFARLSGAGLQPNPDADRRTLIRRLYLDLTGLPPTPEQARAFEADTRPDAYERLVDSLLESPHFGEHMARGWLDAARYADTHGLHMDAGRQVWPYRDWVVDAFNRDLPYSDFVLDQLAGDLRPNPTRDQLIASGFNRMHVTTHEGGVVIDEVRTRNVIDRTSTAATVFMGLSAGCATCHDHKFDPLTQREFYSLYAFFNNFDGDAIDFNRADNPPVLRVPWGEQVEQEQRAMARRQVTRADYGRARQSGWAIHRMGLWLANPQTGAVPSQGFPDAIAHFPLDRRGKKPVDEAGNHWPVVNTLDPERGGRTHGKPRFVRGRVGRGVDLRKEGTINASIADFGRDTPFTLALWARVPKGEDGGLMSRFDDAQQRRRGYALSAEGGRLTLRLSHDVGNAIRIESLNPVFQEGTWTHVAGSYDGRGKASGVRLYVDGKAIPVRIVEDTLLGPANSPWEFRLGAAVDVGTLDGGRLDEAWVFARDLDPREVGLLAGRDTVAAIFDTPPELRSDGDDAFLRSYYLDNVDPSVTEARETARVAALELERLRNDFDATMVMAEMSPPRRTHVLNRGAYDDLGDEVQPTTPAFLPPMDPALPRNRLGLAKWLLSPDHPLTARVAVNRLWLQFFGTGLVETSEDFGAQGGRSSHPELLDWLASEFRGSGWSTKALVRLMVTSSVYRQDSRVTPRELEVDRRNRLYARGVRYRLDGEVIRDQALALGDRLVLDIGGPSVKPPQPAGLWRAVSLPSSNTSTFKADTGDATVRRSLYTYWKRTAPNPVLSTFGTPSRESCTLRRERTNTPLQALVALNEEQFVDAARQLAKWALAAPGLEPAARMDRLWERVTIRLPSDGERTTMLDLLERASQHYRARPEDAKALVGSEAPQGDPAVRLAAWTLVANALLNLDEVLTRG